MIQGHYTIKQKIMQTIEACLLKKTFVIQNLHHSWVVIFWSDLFFYSSFFRLLSSSVNDVVRYFIKQKVQPLIIKKILIIILKQNLIPIVFLVCSKLFYVIYKRMTEKLLCTVWSGDLPRVICNKIIVKYY